MKFLLLAEIVKSLLRNFIFLLLLMGTVAVCCFTEKLGMYRPSTLSEQIIDISDGADDGAQ